MLMPTPGMVTMGMVTCLTDMVIMVTDIMATMARDLPIPLLNLAPTPMPQPTLGTVTMVTGHTGVVIMATDTDIMATMARDLPIKMPLNLDPTPMLIRQPTPGMVTMGMGTTGLTGMAITVTGLTGDKKWTSRTTSDLSLPTHL